ERLAGAAVTAAERLELDDMQGLILRGYRDLPAACFLLFAVTDAVAARAWLAELAPRLTTAAGRPDGAAISRRMTLPGMRARGRPGGVEPSSRLELREGMATEHRGRVLGDVGDSAPEHWLFGGPATPEPHLLLLLYARDDAGLERLVEA